MKKIFMVSFFLLLYVLSRAQSCSLVFKGYITGKKESVAEATIFIKEANLASISDSTGAFALKNLCPGIYTVVITHTAYLPFSATIRFDTGRQVHFELTADSRQLKNITLTAERKKELATVTNVQMKSAELFQQSGRTLGETLKSLPGLNSIQTGPTLSKPVIHGLHSNRVLILNNGIRQEGQQWGSEHAPEIDPFIADRISVIKGAASVRYGSDAIAGVILVEPKILSPVKNWRGR